MKEKYLLILFLLGVPFQVSFAESKKRSAEPHQRAMAVKNLTVENSQKAKTDSANSLNSKKKAKGEEESVDNKNINKQGKRQIAGTAYNCSEVWTDEFSFGYIKVGTKCSTEENLCLAFFHVARNYCEGDSLVRYYCDPKQPSLFSTEKISCKNSCEFSGLSGVCVN